ncbi:phenylacetate--CoA ligase family protein [Chloroflexota bacterium]
MKDYHAVIINKWIFPYSIKLRKGDFKSKMDEALHNQTLTWEDIRNLQFEKLGELIRHAYHFVPYYRDTFKQIGISPQDIRSWEDFEKLPILTKTEVRDNNQQFLSEKQRTPLREYKTSGSTGTPLKVFTGEISIAAEYAVRYRALNYYGVNIGDRFVQIRDADRYPHKTGWKKAINIRLYRPFKNFIFNRSTLPESNISEGDLERHWQYLQVHPPAYISGHSSALHYLAHYIDDRGYDAGSLGMKLIIVGGEKLFDFQKETLERVFKCPVADIYGSFEIGIAACSYPCGALHTNDDFVIMEVIKSSPQDEYGQIIATRLDNWEFPLIRFNVEDLAPLPETHHDCSLGLPFQKVEQIIGRHHDQIKLANGRVVRGSYFSKLLRNIPGIRQYQVNQRELDRFEILTVIDEDNFSIEGASIIKDRMNALFGPVIVTITPVPSIPSEASGKFLVVRSDLV